MDQHPLTPSSDDSDFSDCIGDPVDGQNGEGNAEAGGIVADAVWEGIDYDRANSDSMNENDDDQQRILPKTEAEENPVLDPLVEAGGLHL